MLLLKLVLVPVVIFGITTISTRYGSSLAGLLAGFPVISGPILLFLSLQHGTVYGQEAATSMISGVSGVAIYSLIYARAATRWSWFVAIILASILFYSSSFVLTGISIGQFERFAISMIVVVICHQFIPRVTHSVALQPIKHELLFRIFAGMLLLLVVTTISHAVDASYSGVLASYPVTAVIIPTSMHATQGKDPAIMFLRSLTCSLFSMIVFFTYLSCQLVSQGIVTSFLLGLTLSLITQVFLWQVFALPRRKAMP